MSEQDTAQYFRIRELRQRSMASAAIDPTIAAIHLELADRYAELTDRSESAGRHKLRLVG